MTGREGVLVLILLAVAVAGLTAEEPQPSADHLSKGDNRILTRIVRENRLNGPLSVTTGVVITLAVLTSSPSSNAIVGFLVVGLISSGLQELAVSNMALSFLMLDASLAAQGKQAMIPLVPTISSATAATCTLAAWVILFSGIQKSPGSPGYSPYPTYAVAGLFLSGLASSAIAFFTTNSYARQVGWLESADEDAIMRESWNRVRAPYLQESPLTPAGRTTVYIPITLLSLAY
jgi:hypothetical protein